jgi:hypothetical protein
MLASPAKDCQRVRRREISSLLGTWPGKDRCRQQGQPPLTEDRRQPVTALRGLAEPEDAEPFAGHLQDTPGTGHVRLARGRGLVALADAVEKGRGKRVGRRKGRIVVARHGDLPPHVGSGSDVSSLLTPGRFRFRPEPLRPAMAGWGAAEGLNLGRRHLLPGVGRRAALG